MSETQIEQAMRLAEARLQAHKDRTRRQAELLEKPQGYGREYDETCRSAATKLRRDAGEDQCRIDELHELRRKMKAGEQ